jgi:1-acyl-sn-glycerol-3-phosphate acyltransferase
MKKQWLLSWLFAYPLLHFLTGIQIRGRIPRQGPYIIACNHVSFLDPPIVAIASLREVYFLAKIGLFQGWKFFSRLIESYNAIPINGVQGLRTAVKVLRKGQAVVIFPEGTRSRKGHMLPFNPGVSYLAINLDIPVIPAYIRHSDKRFLTLLMRMYPLRITFGAPMHAAGYDRTAEDYERFAVRLREAVLKLR